MPTWTAGIDERLALTRCVCRPGDDWEAELGACPICAITYSLDGPLVAPECDHWLGRLHERHPVSVLRGRERLLVDHRELPFLARLPIGGSDADRACRATYFRGAGDMWALLHGCAYPQKVVEQRLGEFVELFVPDADKAASLARSVLGRVTRLHWREFVGIGSVLAPPRNANLTIDVTKPRIGDDHDE